MAAGIVLGLNAVTAENSGTTAAPVWEIIVIVRDETLNMETALSDVTDRAANGWRLQVGTLSEATVDTQLVYRAGDATAQPQFVNMRDAFLSKTRILMGFFDGDPELANIPASEYTNGLVGGFGVTNFSIGRQLEEAMMVDVTFTA
ncbi:MAG: hypothetical protein WBN07_02170, partial [Woeseiaceae bacterium]